MNTLTLLEYGDIRVTDDDRFSVFDTVEVIGGKKNPRDAWKSITENYPEVVGKTDNFQFPGQGQRETPVATTENIFYIIGLLPGSVGQMYREDAAREMCAKYGFDYESVVSVKTISVEVNPTSIASTQLRAMADALDTLQNMSHDVHIIKSNTSQIVSDVHGSKAYIVNEIHQGNHEISEDIKQVDESLDMIQSKIDELTTVLKTVKVKTPTKNYHCITFHITSEDLYRELIELADKSGMSRSRFFKETVCKALGVQDDI